MWYFSLLFCWWHTKQELRNCRQVLDHAQLGAAAMQSMWALKNCLVGSKEIHGGKWYSMMCFPITAATAKYVNLILSPSDFRIGLTTRELNLGRIRGQWQTHVPLLPRKTSPWRLWWSPRISSFSRNKLGMGSSGLTRTLTSMPAWTSLSSPPYISNKVKNYPFTPCVCPPQKRLLYYNFYRRQHRAGEGLEHIVVTPFLAGREGSAWAAFMGSTVLASQSAAASQGPVRNSPGTCVISVLATDSPHAVCEEGLGARGCEWNQEAMNMSIGHWQKQLMCVPKKQPFI